LGLLPLFSVDLFSLLPGSFSELFCFEAAVDLFTLLGFGFAPGGRVAF
jgi:hypothetical protein